MEEKGNPFTSIVMSIYTGKNGGVIMGYIR